MSFDIFLHRFVGGDISEGDARFAQAYLDPMITRRDESWARLETVDGEADLYGYNSLGSHLMITHASGRAIWDVMFELARIAGFAVMPVGCGTCITDATDPSDLPPEVPRPITVIRSGQDLLDAVERA